MRSFPANNFCSKPSIETLKMVWNMFRVKKKTTGWRQWRQKRRSSVFIVNYESISHLFLLFLLLTLKKQLLARIVAFYQVLPKKPLEHLETEKMAWKILIPKFLPVGIIYINLGKNGLKKHILSNNQSRILIFLVETRPKHSYDVTHVIWASYVRPS